MILRILKYLFLTVMGLIIISLIFLFAPPLFRRFAVYPEIELQVKALNKLRKEPASPTSLNLYRGVIHGQSYSSHDSEGTISDLIPAAKLNDIDFMFLTDHPRGDIDTLPRDYNGRFDNVLVVPGSGNTRYQGMEIYNIHADTKDETLIPQIANFIINGRKYPQWSLREMFDEQTAIIARWDSLNTVRKIVGFSAVDAHENQNIRARYIKDGRIEWIGSNATVIDTTRVAFWNSWLLHPPYKSGWIFRLMTDTYREGFKYITNYVYADSLSVESLSDNIKKGHLYSAFRSFGDAGGFMFNCTDQKDGMYGMMGDSVSLGRIKAFYAVSPLPGQFRLIRDGKTVNSSSFNTYEYKWEDLIEKGAYRIEIHIIIREKDLPWLYSNPIYVY